MTKHLTSPWMKQVLFKSKELAHALDRGVLLYQVVNLVLYYVLLGIYIRDKGTPGMFDPVL